MRLAYSFMMWRKPERAGFPTERGVPELDVLKLRKRVDRIVTGRKIRELKHVLVPCWCSEKPRQLLQFRTVPCRKPLHSLQFGTIRRGEVRHQKNRVERHGRIFECGRFVIGRSQILIY
jgi:hypothetical protein